MTASTPLKQERIIRQEFLGLFNDVQKLYVFIYVYRLKESPLRSTIFRAYLYFKSLNIKIYKSLDVICFLKEGK